MMFRRSLLAAFALLFAAAVASADTKTATVTAGKPVDLEFAGVEDGQTTYRGVWPDNGALLEYDVYPHSDGTLYSLTVDLSRNDPTLRNIDGYRIEVDGHVCEFPKAVRIAGEPEQEYRSRMQRIMCRTRFAWGDIPPKRPQTFYQFAPAPRPVVWAPADWAIEPGGYGKLASLPPATAAGYDRSCHLPNWVTGTNSDQMIRAYADADGNYAVAVREPTAPYTPIARDGFQMGYNAFSFAAYKFETAIGRKFQLPHATANSVIAWLVYGDLYYKRSLINFGNFAAMHNGIAWPAAGQEYRGIWRGMNQMLVATAIDNNPWRRAKIIQTLEYFDRCAAEPFGSIPKKPGGVPFMITTKGDKTFINYWMASFAFYTIDLAERMGYTQGQAYLKALMDYQAQLGPSNVGVYSPYWLAMRDPTKPLELSNLYATGESGVQSTNDREAECYVMGEIMRRHGRRPPRPLDGLMREESMHPIRKNAAFFISDPSRPKPRYVVTVIGRNGDGSASTAVKETDQWGDVPALMKAGVQDEFDKWEALQVLSPNTKAWEANIKVDVK